MLQSAGPFHQIASQAVDFSIAANASLACSWSGYLARTCFVLRLRGSRQSFFSSLLSMSLCSPGLLQLSSGSRRLCQQSTRTAAFLLHCSLGQFSSSEALISFPLQLSDPMSGQTSMQSYSWSLKICLSVALYCLTFLPFQRAYICTSWEISQNSDKAVGALSRHRHHRLMPGCSSSSACDAEMDRACLLLVTAHTTAE